ncbi:hypothetical protein LTR08_002280 [Meristemomyces frigidus]|nr:hypothetical protein LTR08_002280 [Meristemomyces frigidus]
MKTTLLSLICAASGALAAPHRRSEYAVKDSHAVPSQWKQIARAPKEHTVTLRIGLKQNDFDGLERELYSVSDPAHERYGQRLSSDDVNKLVAPDEDTLSAVHDWLEGNSVRLDQVDYSPSRDWIIVPLSIGDIETLLDTEYHIYENAEGTQVVRTPQYSLPKSLHRHVDVVQPTNYFSDTEAMRKPFKFSKMHLGPHHEFVPPGYKWNHPKYSGTNITAVCNESAVTNLCLRTLYNTVDYVPQVPELNSVALTAYLNETANISDFHIFLSRQRADASLDYTFNYTTIADGIDFQSLETTYYGERDLEANLDSQTIGGIVYPTEFKVYSTGGSPPFKADENTPTDTNEPYLTWLAYMLALENPPHTISTSYGDDEQSVPYSYAKRVCADMAQLGARGVSLIFSSGDSGVGANGTCVSNDGNSTRKFLPAFPASCPYVTTVGATRNVEPEVVAYDVSNGYVTGSGLSNYFPRPAYQNAAVEGYLDSIGDLHAGLFNTTGRAYPDIAAQGFHYVIVYAGLNILLDGTSCAAPTATAVLTLVNDALLAEGKAPLGFLNPALYSKLHLGFTDITIGNAFGCNTSGFPAQQGYDLASGWGTPDFLKIKALATGGQY